MNNLIEILMVEDNPGHIRAMQECFRTYKIVNPVNFVEDEGDLLAFLRQQGQYAQAQFPDIMLLGLGKLLTLGCAALAEIKTDSLLNQIPIVALVDYEGEQDALPAEKSIASFYITRPVTLQQLRSILLQIEGLWFSMVKVERDDDVTPYATV